MEKRCGVDEWRGGTRGPVFLGHGMGLEFKELLDAVTTSASELIRLLAIEISDGTQKLSAAKRDELSAALVTKLHGNHGRAIPLTRVCVRAQWLSAVYINPLLSPSIVYVLCRSTSLCIFLSAEIIAKIVGIQVL